MNKNQEFLDNGVVEEEEFEMEEKVSFGKKVAGFAKKHGKKVLTGVLVAAAGVAGYAIGHKSGSSDDVSSDDYDSVIYEFEGDCSEE